MNHSLRMILGCLIPLLLVFVIPLFGVSQGIALLIFIVLMFGCHLFMMRGHGQNHMNHRKDDPRKGGGHGDA